MKIVFVGAGCVGFTRNLLRDILSIEALNKCGIAFTDIDENNLSMVTKLCQRDIDENGLNLTIQSTTDRRQALTDANYVFFVFRIGGLEAFKLDIDIPLTYGVDQCVGDTLCAGGIMYGQRGIPVALDICKDIKEVASGDCLILNYANPNAMITWACNHYGHVKTVGLCHGVQGGHHLIARALGYEQEEVDIICAGINHQTWYVRIEHEGKDLTGELLEALIHHEEYSQTEKVRIDMLKRFGYFSTESNGHLSEYVPWYRKRPDAIKKWIDLNNWINGETGGYLRICTEGRMFFESDFENWMKEPYYTYNEASRSHEHGSYIIEGLETGKLYRGHFNVVNNHVINNLPVDAIVEVPGYVDRNGMNIPVVGELPLGCAAVCNVSINVQRLSVEAAVSGDDTLLRQAMMMDPLVGAVCDPNEIWQMVDDLLIAQEQWLPQYKKAIKKAKKRQCAEERLPVIDGYEGAARISVKSIHVMKEEAEKNRLMAGASDKGMNLEGKK